MKYYYLSIACCIAGVVAGRSPSQAAVPSTGTETSVTVRNPADFARADEMVEIDLAKLASRLPAGPLAVVDQASDQPVVCQLLDLDGNGVPEKLIFQTDLAPRTTRAFRIVAANTLRSAPRVVVKTYARFVPERYDDFAWENDRIAFRMYGPALIKAEGFASSGIDVWVKRTPRLVINKWYKAGDYHRDHGEGLDAYGVGPTRGCGGLGIWDGKALHNSSNFKSWRILANGPLRSVFELTYDAWDANGRKISEVKRISLDAGSHFNRIESTFSSPTPGPLTLGIGIARHGHGGTWNERQQAGWFAYWEPEAAPNGHIACAVVVPGGIAEFAHTTSERIAVVTAVPNRPLLYFAGAGWSKGGEFNRAADWSTAVGEFARRRRQPLIVNYTE